MNDRSRNRDEGFEALVCLARAHGYPSVFLQLAEVILDQVSPFVGFLVKRRGKFPIGFRRYDRDDVAILQVISQPIRIEGPVRQQMPRGQATDQRFSLAQIVRLSGHQAEIDEVAECVCQGQYLRRYAATRTSDGLAKSPPFAP